MRLPVLLLNLLLCTCVSAQMTVKLPAELADNPVDGRLLLMFSAATEGEPRFQITDGPATGQVYGVDVEN